ncbi:hypothetical protein FEM33_05905 [Dyadobacter flavalbus]|uniref:Glycosyltransferase RgtA/B/C/D-like domain-containing protein n=1 Tax=Dyadobacter flavalbus TaxID=2579942 RepID=A0A5M8QXN1_9BACT|nr:hypothetical protein [Dyadobacter flavalbus]KAA6440141.1 hypothetical protein FEM33_05905 [Dyadobacter flavalbus]
MLSRKLYTSLFITALFLIIFLLKDHFTVELYQDEFHYLPTAVLFSHEILPSIDLLKSYNELNTPVPFILGGWVVRIFGENIQHLRLLTFATSFLLLMLFIWNSPDRSKRFWLCLAGLMAFPNYYLCSVYYYTDIFALFFVLAGIIAYLKRMHLGGLLLFVAAVSCRQYMLAFPAAIVAYEFCNVFRSSSNVRDFINRLLIDKVWIYYAIAVLSIIPWFLLWKGPAPAEVMAQQHYDSDKLVKYNFGYVMYACVCLSVYYVIPEVVLTGKAKYFVDYPRRHPRLFVLLLLLVAVMVLFFPARQAHNPYFTWPYLGYIDQFMMTIGITGMIKQLCFGLLMLLALMRFISPQFNLAGWMMVLNTLLLGKAQLSWDKYSLPVIMALWFLTMFDAHWSLSEKEAVTKSVTVK